MYKNKFFNNYLSELNRSHYNNNIFEFFSEENYKMIIERYNSQLDIYNSQNDIQEAINLIPELFNSDFNNSSNHCYHLDKNLEHFSLKISVAYKQKYEDSKISIRLIYPEIKQLFPITESLLGFGSEIIISFPIDNIKFSAAHTHSYMKTNSFYNIFENIEPNSIEDYYPLSHSANNMLFNQIVFPEKTFDPRKLYMSSYLNYPVKETPKDFNLLFLKCNELIKNKMILEKTYDKNLSFESFKDFIDLVYLNTDKKINQEAIIKFYDIIEKDKLKNNNLKIK